jgi:LAO/AO transport system kinase
MEIIEKVLKADARAIAKTISLIENNSSRTQSILKELYPHTGNAFILGVTGPPGAGKSTLVDKLAELIRKQEKTIGIIAIDPTSPFSGGAILGDRIRMQRHSTDPGIFIRSMATRGHLGGLSRATNDAITVLDASGKDIIIIETVGVGQDEVEIVNTAHTSIVVLTPIMGDDIQTIKAGIMEIADVFVINKADKGDYRRLEVDLKNMIEQFSREDGWEAPIVATVAIKDTGLEELLQKIYSHREYILKQDLLKYKAKIRSQMQLMDLIKELALQKICSISLSPEVLEQHLEKIVARESDPYSAAEDIIAAFLKHS